MSPTNSISVIAQLAKQAADKSGIDSTVLGAGVGSLVGGLGGLALNPGVDTQGNKRSRLRKALLGALSGAGLGGAVGYSLNKLQDTDKDLSKVDPVSGLGIQEIPEFEPGDEDLSLVDPVTGIAKVFNKGRHGWYNNSPLSALNDTQSHLLRINYNELNTHPFMHLSRRLQAMKEKYRREEERPNYLHGAAIYSIRDLLRRLKLHGFRDHEKNFFPNSTGSYDPAERSNDLLYDITIPEIKSEYRDPTRIGNQTIHTDIIKLFRAWHNNINLLDPRHPGNATLPKPYDPTFGD